MIISMDLNASPLPEEDAFPVDVEEENAVEEHVETAVETMRREREERRQRLKREFPDEGPKRVVQPMKDKTFQSENTRFYDRSKLPPGWLDCPAFGQPIDCIIPSKVPLGEHFDGYITRGKRYSMRQVIHQQKVLGRELGLVIDLTNTTRYYSPSDWQKQSIKHVKIACKGRDSVPDNESVNNFVYEVLQFRCRQKHSKKYILVHCTHGHNRTGYMIAHFLMRSQHISISEAIQAFAHARPPGIYKPDYIDALYMFYHERRPDTIECPPTPEWKRSSDLDLNGDAVLDDDDGVGVAAPLQEDHLLTEPMTNDDILGDAVPYDQQEEMRRLCHRLLDSKVRVVSQFPGSHPVSLNRENLQLLSQRYYYATWKADGTRYMMLLTHDGCYLIDRNFCFRRVQMRFPIKFKLNEGAKDTHNITLLDGEMVIDAQDNGKQERRYLIYDVMVLNNLPLIKRPFNERWKMIEEEVIQPRNVERQKMEQSRIPYYRYDMEPFRVRRKAFWLLSTVWKLLKEFIPKLSHAADGLIFQGWDDPYVTRTHEGLLKWKYPEMNSVDFLFEVLDDDRHQLYLYERGKKKLMEGNHVVFSEAEASSYSGKIIECSWNSDKEVWVCMRIRTDKSTPNDFNTYRKVMRSIKDNITEENLLSEIDEIVRLPMYADRIQTEIVAHSHHQQPGAGRRR
ncbi:hypothetical protein Syun_009286 [Stephania yunnanensis]|uniref:mRNA guanylyltransferase n=1 Tax=Stephania yunnanensis TaxID=152371 RepID=A0AAP0KGN9_9MAGN